MVRKIEKDALRFRQIVRGRIKKDLRKYITQGEMIGKQGKHLVSIPLPQIEIPRFRYGSNQKSGVGQGEGGEGTPVDAGGEGSGQGGDAPGRHILEVEVTLDELAQILGEELELPRIRPKGNANIQGQRERYTGIRTTGPESLRHLKRTFRRALKRQIAAGIYDPERPVIIPIREDKRYLSWQNRLLPENNAVVIYMMDVSGSMGTEQKEIVRIASFWIDTWLRSQYKNIEVRYIVHDAVAREVDQHTFYHLRESGGTKISSAYELCARMIDQLYSPDDWNIYPFHFSDGDNWSGKDTERCVELLRQYLVPAVNQFSYGQVKSAYGSGQFKGDLEKSCGDEETLVTSEIPNRESIPDCIKAFLGKGR
jgi:uncharacterized sporulation protein YeaH/YhbH (DUF444 family)